METFSFAFSILLHSAELNDFFFFDTRQVKERIGDKDRYMDLLSFTKSRKRAMVG
jgi:hypothetical protein